MKEQEWRAKLTERYGSLNFVEETMCGVRSVSAVLGSEVVGYWDNAVHDGGDWWITESTRREVLERARA